jgi:hypothetical protein
VVRNARQHLDHDGEADEVEVAVEKFSDIKPVEAARA